jgi:hypothetical protein
MKLRNEWMTDSKYFGDNYPNNRFLDDVVKRFEIQRDESLEGQDSLIDGIPERIVVQNSSNTMNQSKYDKKIHCSANSMVHTGSIIEFNNKKWLAISKVFDNLAYKTVNISECNNIINLYKDNILYQIPCVVESNVRLYSMGVDDEKYISIPSTEIIVRVPNNNITSIIKRDDIYKIGLQNYKIIDINDVIEDGLFILKMEYSLEDQVLPIYSLSILNGDTLQIANTQELIIQTEVVDTVSDNIINPTPPITFTTSDDEIAEIDVNGNVNILNTGTVVFTAMLTNDNSISDSITVTIVEVEQNNYHVVIDGSTSIIKGQSENYVCTFYNNGSPINTETSIFYLTGDDGISETNLAQITYQDIDGNCTVKANNTLGYVKLWVRNKNSSVVGVPLRIRIKNIF